MPPNITVTSAAGFIPEIWANRALEILRANIAMAKLVMRDTDVATFQVGDTLNLNIPGTFIAKDKVADAPVTLQKPVDAPVQVVLNKHKEVSFLVEDAVRAQNNISAMDEYMNNGVVAIAEAIENDLFALTLDAMSSIGALGTPLTGASLRAARNQLNKQKAPRQDRYAVLSSDDETSVLGDTSLQTYFANAKPEVIERGAIGVLYGLETYMSQITPLGAKVALGGATGGSFKIGYRGQTTAAIAFNATAATVKTAIEALSTVGAGNVEVIANTTGYEIYMKGALAGSHDQITGDVSTLTGATNAAITDTNWNPVFQKGAFLLAMRGLPEPEAGSGAKSVAIKDPESGLVVRVLHAYNATYLGHQVTIDVLYGAKTVRPAKAVNVKS